MTIQHHPADETLFRYAAGNLAASPALVIATHLSFCPDCERVRRGFASVCGQLLCSGEETPMSPGALAATLARLDETIATTPLPVLNPDLPPPLAIQPIAPWRWIAPGISLARIGPRTKGSSLFLLRCAPGSSLPAHHHAAPEYSCVIKGAYSDASGRYGVGDTEETGVDLSHAPTVDDSGECIAIIAVEGKLQLEGWLPRLLQPFIGI